MKLKERWQKLFPKNRPRAGVIRLGQRRLYVLPTRLGFVFLIMLGMMFSGAINYELSLGYAVVFWLLSVMLLSALHANLNLAYLRLSARFDQRTFAGEPMTLHVCLRQDKSRLRPSLRLAYRQTHVDFDVRDEQCDVRVPLATHERGRYSVPRLMLETRYPLGLFRCWTYLDFDTEDLVYPAQERPAPPLPANSGSQHDGRGWKNGGDEFAGLREWRPEDAPRLIAWRQSARNNQMLTKTFHTPRGEQLWLDWFSTSGDTEARLSRLSSWVVQAEIAGFNYGLRLPGRQLEPASGAKHREQCLAALALF